jgi:hypothetical protein
MTGWHQRVRHKDAGSVTDREGFTSSLPDPGEALLFAETVTRGAIAGSST